MYLEIQKSLNSQSYPEGDKRNPGGITIPEFKLYYTVTVIKTCHCQKSRHTKCNHLLLDKSVTNIHWRKEYSQQTMMAKPTIHI